MIVPTGVMAYPNLLGGPFKPSFGLSGAVRHLDTLFPLLVHVFVRLIPIRSIRVPAGTGGPPQRGVRCVVSGKLLPGLIRTSL